MYGHLRLTVIEQQSTLNICSGKPEKKTDAESVITTNHIDKSYRHDAAQHIFRKTHRPDPLPGITSTFNIYSLVASSSSTSFSAAATFFLPLPLLFLAALYVRSFLLRSKKGSSSEFLSLLFDIHSATGLFRKIIYTESRSARTPNLLYPF